ncbi:MULTISPECIES: hypothetical protein [Streptomyces]|nr:MULTISPECIES: hypothetical protein [Streptomyces]
MDRGGGADQQGVALAASYGEEPRALEGVEAAGGARALLEDDRVLDAGLG